MVIKDLQIKKAECTEYDVFEDNVMTITYVPLVKSENIDTIKEVIDSEEDTFNEKSVQMSIDSVCLF